MSDSDNDNNNESGRRVRTFVLISGLPANSATDPLISEKHLLQTLRAQTTGMMRCLLDTAAPTHALALFESREAAVDAAEPGKVQIVHGPDGSQTSTLVLRPILNERAAVPDRAYSETVAIDGQQVPKVELAATNGLAAVLKSLASAAAPSASAATAGQPRRGGPDGVARWCRSTLRGEDCPFGERCWYIHRKQHQVTVVPTATTASRGPAAGAANGVNLRVRQRPGDGAADAGAAPDNAAAAAAASPSAVTDASLLVHAAIPAEWRGGNGAVPAELVPLALDADVPALLRGDSPSSATLTALEAAFGRLKQQSGATLFFVKFDVPHGSASDVALFSAAADTKAFAASIESAPQALKRDVRMHARLAAAHQNLAVHNVQEAVALLLQSRKAKAALGRAAELAASTPVPIHLRVEPFDSNLWLPASQFQILVRMASAEAGGSRFVGAAQRTSWILVDVCQHGRSAGSPAEAPKLLLSEQLGLVMDWRQTSQDSVRRVVEGLIGAGRISGNVLASAAVKKQGLLALNVAVSGTVNNGALAPSPPRVLSVHDGEDTLRRSTLLPFSMKTAAELRLLWRTDTPVKDIVPAAFQE